MKTTLKFLSAGIVTAFCCSIGSAQIIYSNAFDGSGAVNIASSAPTVANTFAGGSSSAVWHDGLGANDTGMMGANGISTSLLDDAWTLPFTPSAGHIYDLTATLTFSAYPGSWVGIGFAQNWTTGHSVGHGGFKDSTSGDPNGYGFMILTESSGNVQAFLGPHATVPAYNLNGTFTANTPASHTVDITLDTTSAKWSLSFSLDGNLLLLNDGLTSTNYASNPSIGAVGFTQNTLTGGSDYQWSDFALTVVPEPTVLALAGFGLVLFAFRRR